MTTRPRIAIPSPTSIDPDYNQRSWKNYADAIVEAGAEAVAIDPLADPAAVRSLISSCSGIVLPGSPADVDPFRYGIDREEGCGPADAAREQTDWALLDHAEAERKPVLGICYGIQSLTAWSGGALIQDLAPLPVNHAAGAKVAIAHGVVIDPNSLLGTLIRDADDVVADGEFLRLPVNSSHHQAVATPGDGLRLTARCPEDGVVEAVERAWSGCDDWWVIGVQWHPERSTTISAASRALFTAFVSEASRRSMGAPVLSEAGCR